MAQLKNTLISGNARVTGTLFSTNVDLSNLKIGGSQGTAGQVLKVNSGATGVEWGAAADVINGVTISHLNQDNSPHYWGGSLLFDSPNNATYQGRIEAYTKAGTDSDSGDYLRFLAIKISDSSYNAGVQISLTNGILFGAAWNDYAEYRRARTPIAPGRVVVDTDEGAVVLASERLQPGAQVVSDTYGFIEGKTEDAKTPIAVAGRVLVYPYRSRAEYHAGMCVCSAPDGTVDIMTRDEIKEYPDCIVGIVSEIPTYETWGETNVKVDGRIWVKVK